MLSYAKFRMLDQLKKKIFLNTGYGHKFIWNLMGLGINTFLKLRFVFVILCDAWITHAATEKPYRADRRESVHKIWFRHVLDELELKIFFVGQPWWPTCFMLHLSRKLSPHLWWFHKNEAAGGYGHIWKGFCSKMFKLI